MSGKKEKDAGHDAPEGEGEDGAEGGKKKPPMMIIIAGAVGALVILGGGGVGAMLLMGGKSKAQDEAHAEKPKKEKEKKKDEKGKDGAGKDAKSPITEGPDGVVFYAMPDMVVNIQAADSRPTYLKLKLAFELPDETTADAVEAD